MLIGSKGGTATETIFVCIILFFTVGLFATILSRISMILDDLYAKNQAYKRD